MLPMKMKKQAGVRVRQAGESEARPRGDSWGLHGRQPNPGLGPGRDGCRGGWAALSQGGTVRDRDGSALGI